MAAKFAATTLLRSQTESGLLTLTLADAAGKTRALTLTSDLVQTLAGLMAEHATPDRQSPLEAMKRPQTYAIGTGTYENLVLLRFEDDAPYALPARSALELAKALLEQSETVVTRPVALLQ